MPKTKGADIAHARERRALHLRIVGRMTYEQIAEQPLTVCPAHPPSGMVGCSACGRLYHDRSTARRAVVRALERDFPAPTAEQREAYVAEQAATLSMVLARATRDAIDPGHSVEQRARATTSVVALLRRQANLLGLDARHRTPADDALDAEIRALVDELTAGG